MKIIKKNEKYFIRLLNYGIQLDNHNVESIASLAMYPTNGEIVDEATVVMLKDDATRFLSDLLKELEEDNAIDSNSQRPSEQGNLDAPAVDRNETIKQVEEEVTTVAAMDQSVGRSNWKLKTDQPKDPSGMGTIDPVTPEKIGNQDFNKTGWKAALARRNR